jgi:hypothetical protein
MTTTCDFVSSGLFWISCSRYLRCNFTSLNDIKTHADDPIFICARQGLAGTGLIPWRRAALRLLASFRRRQLAALRRVLGSLPVALDARRLRACLGFAAWVRAWATVRSRAFVVPDAPVRDEAGGAGEAANDSMRRRIRGAQGRDAEMRRRNKNKKQCIATHCGELKS